MSNCFDHIWCRELLHLVLCGWIERKYEEFRAQCPPEQDADIVSKSILQQRLCSGFWFAHLINRIVWICTADLSEKLPPECDVETTPDLQESLGAFRTEIEILFQYHAELKDRAVYHVSFDNAFSHLDMEGMLLLLGQRHTPSSLRSIQGVPPPLSLLLEAATKPYHLGHILHMCGRALCKHAARSSDSWWETPNGNDSQKNSIAIAVLNSILTKKTWWNTFSHYHWGVVFEVRVASGHGVRWSDDGRRFIGFLEPFTDSIQDRI